MLTAKNATVIADENQVPHARAPFRLQGSTLRLFDAAAHSGDFSSRAELVEVAAAEPAAEAFEQVLLVAEGDFQSRDCP